jgi:sulfur transfer protein SufE
MSNKLIIEEEIKEFSSDDEIFYDYMLTRKKDLIELDESERTSMNKIQGCMSIVHIEMESTSEGRKLKAYSDSSIISGILGIIGLAIKDDKNPIIENYRLILEPLKKALSQNRRLGFENMLLVIFKNK